MGALQIYFSILARQAAFSIVESSLRVEASHFHKPLNVPFALNDLIVNIRVQKQGRYNGGSWGGFLSLVWPVANLMNILRSYITTLESYLTGKYPILCRNLWAKNVYKIGHRQNFTNVGKIFRVNLVFSCFGIGRVVTLNIVYDIVFRLICKKLIGSSKATKIVLNAETLFNCQMFLLFIS